MFIDCFLLTERLDGFGTFFFGGENWMPKFVRSEFDVIKWPSLLIQGRFKVNLKRSYILWHMPKPSESELSKPSRSDSRETSKQVCVVRHLAMVQKLPWTQKETEWSPRANDERCARVSINISSLACRVTLQSFGLPCRLATVASAAHCRYSSIWDCWERHCLFGESPSSQEHLQAVFQLSVLLSSK